MELIKIDKKLKRIITVYDTFKDEGKIFQLEKDLLLGYIRELYELVSDIDASSTPSTVQNTLLHKPIVDQKHTLIETNIKQTKEKETPIVPIETAVDYIKPVQFNEPSHQVVEVKPSIEVEKKEIQVATAQTTKIIEEAPKQNINMSTEMRQLFTITKARDISERLAMSPIADIAKAMSINDKMLILKELFGNDVTLFNDSISKLNGYSTFEEAKSLLVDTVAVKYQWDNSEKIEKAEAFIKLVSRRYQQVAQ
ncbi:MAG TPA: hypothetical protein PKD85_11320 [Saprospiraceae bacterium]|nr:hypothetical protein [Saprospiraceae bacterium]